MRRLFLFAALALAPAPALAQDIDPPPSIMEKLEEHEDLILEKIKAFDTERYDRLVALKASDPRAYWRTMFQVGRTLKRVADATPPDPEVKAAMQRLAELKAAHPDGVDGLSGKERKAVQAELTEIATTIFEARQTARRTRIDAARAQLAELEDEVARRDAERDSLIRAWVDRAMEGPVDL